MKKIIGLLAIVVLAAVSFIIYNVKADKDVPKKAEKPEQEVMFVIVGEKFYPQYELTGCVVDSDGNFHTLPDDFTIDNDVWCEDWYEKLLEVKKEKAVYHIEESDLQVVYEFVNSSGYYDNIPMKKYDYTMYDYGCDKLYWIYYKNGSPHYKLLCKYGSSTECISAGSVREFVNWMSDKQFFYTEDFRY